MVLRITPLILKVSILYFKNKKYDHASNRFTLLKKPAKSN